MGEEIIKIPKIISVGELAKKLGVSTASVVGELMKNGVMATINENIDFETAAIIAEYMGKTVEEEEIKAKTEPDKKITLKNVSDGEERPPVIAVMGHVDHGKTKLLDTIRNTNVMEKEAGGITQRIGSYQVEVKGRKITFIDTPGHSAFEEMRAHGANITDIALIVIAADDGIKPQTLEAINHAKKANTTMIMVINKVDKPGADVNRVYQQLTEIGYTPEEWGGKTVVAKVSARTGEGVDELLELILLVADLLELRADHNAPATGVVVESRKDIRKGSIARILVQNGTLHNGDFVQIGETFCRVRSIEDFNNKRVKEATPGMPVLISGMKEVPKVGEVFTVFEDEKEAKKACEEYRSSIYVKKYSNIKKINLESITNSIALSEAKELALVVKADRQGSLDAIIQALEKFSTPEVIVKIISASTGEITESDIMMARTASKLIVAFNVQAQSAINTLAKNEGVRISIYRVIYELLNDIKTVVEDLLPPKEIEITNARFEVIQVFSKNKKLTVAGGKVIEGKVEKGPKVRVLRNNEEIGSAKILTIQRGKDEVRECQVGTECGLGVETSIELEPKDILVFYSVEQQKQSLDIKI